MSGGSQRSARLHGVVAKDQRGEFERDRDRVLYSSAFRRLGGITQVVSADQGQLFHNRLTHSIKVAQVGRRLAQHILRRHTELADILDVEVVECAALAHDLGHPPFGHIGESELNLLVEAGGDGEGFEGNAQSFRILTKLSTRFEGIDGLDLTRASLAASLKYPWLRDTADPKRGKKWGAYSSDAEAFEFASEGREQQNLEASIMDLADDLAYSVHDSEDFHRAGLIPWGQLFLTALADEEDESAQIEGEAANLIKSVAAGWWQAPQNAEIRATSALKRLMGLLPATMKTEVYQGSREQRRDIRFWTSTLLGRYIQEVEIGSDGPEPHATLPEELDDEVRVLKGITWKYAIQNPALAAQQHGQRRILRELFEDLAESVRYRSKQDLLPMRFRYLVDELHSGAGSRCRPTVPRVVADCLVSMTEEETVLLHQRLRGLTIGSVLNPILR